MKLRRRLRTSTQALSVHPFRTGLALATIAIGTTAMIVTSAMSAGARRQVLAGLEQVGTNLLIVRPAPVTPTVARPAIRGPATTLTLDDAEALRQISGVELVAPGSDRGVRARSATAAAPASLLGTTAAFAEIRHVSVASGRFVSAADVLDAARIAVLGARIARVLFDDENPLGKSIMLGRVPFDVVGVLRPKGAGADGSDQDGQVFVPVTTAMRRVNHVTWVGEIFVRARGEQDLPRAERAITTVMGLRHRSLDFEVQNTAALLASQNRTVESLDTVTAIVALVTLAIGGGGIVALMFLGTTERTSEIGLRIAVGARPRDIVLQFMFEAGVLCLAGWFLGIVVGGATSVGLATTMKWSVAVPLDTIAMSLLVATAGGMVAGVLPARRASRVPPMRALLSR